MNRRSNLETDFGVSARKDSDGGVRIALSGQLSLQNLNRIQEELRSVMRDMKPNRLTIDLGGVDYLDSGGALALLKMEVCASRESIPFTVLNANSDVQGILSLVDHAGISTPPLRPKATDLGLIELVGEKSQRIAADFSNIVTFLGDLLMALVHTLFHPRTVRWSDVLLYVKRAGLEGLPIVALLSFLLGLIIAFMSSLQLKQFGANLYVASLVGFGMVRELGPIMTAIIIAGRSGSAFAAEIGTMMVNEEVDALVTMGFNSTRFLALPKVLAAMLVVPLLTLYSDLFGILGGMVVGVAGFDLTAYTYITQTIKSISIFDLVTSLIKAVVFAVLIAGIGCQRGFCVRGGAEAVGTYTTSAVVAGLFLIIVADSIFAIILYYIR